MTQEQAPNYKLALEQVAQEVFKGIELPTGRAANYTSDDDPLDLLSVVLILDKRGVRKLLRTMGWMFYGWYATEMEMARLYQGKPLLPSRDVQSVFSNLMHIVVQLLALSCPMCTTVLFLLAGLYWARYDTDRSGSNLPREVWKWLSAHVAAKMQAQDSYDIMADVQNILRNKPKEDGHAPA